MLRKARTTNLLFARQLLRLLSHFFKFNKLRILWIGDSHAVYMRRGLRFSLDQNNPMESLVYWLGPRLMYSVSKSGFPMSLFFRFCMRLWKPKVVIISLGETYFSFQLIVSVPPMPGLLVVRSLGNSSIGLSNLIFG